MQKRVEIYLLKLNKGHRFRQNLRHILLVLSMLVILGVFWWLKLTGITMAGEAFCGNAEHVHSEKCMQRTLLCTLQEESPKANDTVTQNSGNGEISFTSGEEAAVFVDEPQVGADSSAANMDFSFSSGETEAESSGYNLEAQNTQSAGTAGHIHTDACYGMVQVCGMTEHIHEAGCYSDVTADIENSDDWEMSLEGVDRSGSTAENVVQAARSQLGYQESIRNFTVDANGIRRGITRYGQWYGNPYGDWSAMFASFCLHYAGVEDLPANAGPESMRLEWEAEGLYKNAQEYTPQAGNLLFLHREITEDRILEAQGTDSGEGNIPQRQTEPVNTAPSVEEIEPADAAEFFTSGNTDSQAGTESSGTGEEFAGNTELSEPAGDTELFTAEAAEHTESSADVEIFTGAQADGGTAGNTDSSADAETFTGVQAEGNAEPAEDTASGTSETSEEMEIFRAESTEHTNTTETTEDIEIFQNSAAPAGANAVAIITGIGENGITVIEGDLHNTAVETTYALDDPAILGYGLVPEVSDYVALLAAPSGAEFLARTVTYKADMFNESSVFVVYTNYNGNYYAIDGSGNAVPVYIENGNILTDFADPNLLLWKFTRDNNGYRITNLGNGRYLHPFRNNSGNGVITSNAWPTAVNDYNGGARLSHTSDQAYVRLNANSQKFEVTSNWWEPSVFQFGETSMRTVWLDGTNGNLMALTGAPNKKYTVYQGGTLTLPTRFQSPSKYSYVLRGWYDVLNSRYYLPGETVTVNDNMVFYADWAAASYDIGFYNGQVADTLSTNAFITTHVFDYGILFNVMSSHITSKTVNENTHTETWSLVSNGTVPYHNDPYHNENTLNFIFRDWDTNNKISYPLQTNDRNTYQDAEVAGGQISRGLYNSSLHDLLFNTGTSYNPQTGEGVIGKTYLGQGDHLFQYEDDPSSPNYGYYYYDSMRNAASYNQSDQRFYVYDYLECTTDSYNNGETGESSDFLPLNSPYANINGQQIPTYRYSGINGEYNNDTEHYRYDAKNGTNNDNSNKNVTANYGFGMSIDIDFYLPDKPGGSGNKDVHGKDLHFKFSGDDDVWILIDEKLVLDIGGIHGVKRGDINFTSGVVTVEGNPVKTITDFSAGAHTLTVLYLERGSSQSNCAIYFNLAPRYHFSIQKEDILTREILNGAQFSVFMDEDCKNPAELWESSEAYHANEDSSNVFTVVNGTAEMWGMVAGATYYIKETQGPNAKGYGCASGIIRVSLNKDGAASYHVDVMKDENGKLSAGFTVHGFRIDEETQKAYIIVTNASAATTETTTVQVRKKWQDAENHSDDYVKVYLTVTDAEGRVSRIRETILSAKNDWRYQWSNLPKYKYESDGKTEIVYGVEEAYTPGYMAQVFQPLVETEVDTTETIPVEKLGWQITNIPLEKETSLTVQKNWEFPEDVDESVYEQEKVTVKLLANGTDTGRSEILTLKNDWSAVFRGLPYADAEGKVISYTVKEIPVSDQWQVTYGSITSSGLNPPTYSTVVTNTWRTGGPELPATGFGHRLVFFLCGFMIMLVSAGYGCFRRWKQKGGAR